MLPVSPVVSSGETVNITGPITSNGAANVVTSRQLAVDLAIAQSKGPFIGTTLSIRLQGLLGQKAQISQH